MMATSTMSAWGLHYITGSPPDLKASGTTSLCRGVKDKSAVGKNLTNVTNATVHRPKSALWGFMRWICIMAVRRYICEWGHFPSQGCHRQPNWWITSQIYYGLGAPEWGLGGRKRHRGGSRGESMVFKGVLCSLHLLCMWTTLEMLLFVWCVISNFITTHFTFYQNLPFLSGIIIILSGKIWWVDLR